MRKLISLIPLFVCLTLPACKSKEQQLKEAEEEGKFKADKTSKELQGLGEGLQGEGKKAAESLSEGIGEVFKGVSKGFNESLEKVVVDVDAELQPVLEVGRAGKRYNDSTQTTTIVLYTVFNKDFNGQLILRMLDKNNQEIGRQLTSVNKKAEESDFVEFSFDKRTQIAAAERYSLKAKK